jgi:hypothetical protein
LRHRAPLTAALLVLLTAACFVAGSAQGSVKVGEWAKEASLRVDAAGNAEVDWTSSQGAQSVVIDRSGALRYGGKLTAPDVTHSVAEPALPWALVVRQGPDGSFYALQSWQRLVDGPVELRFSRWRGDPTKLTLHAVCCKWGGENIKGNASFHGKPIYGFKATRQGDPLDPYGRNVYLDSFRAGHWQRMMGILAKRPAGQFSLWIRSVWAGTAYRGTISGPNWGWTLGPDAFAETQSSR